MPMLNKRVSSKPHLFIAIFIIICFLIASPLALSKNRRFNPSTQKVEMNIVDVLANDENFTILLQLIEAARLSNTLREAENITIFAPTNDAFKDLSQKTLEALFKPENRFILTAILTYHVVPYRITWRDLPGNKLTLKTLLAGSTMVLMKSKEDCRVLLAKNDSSGMDEINAQFLREAYEATNGNVYTIDTVLIPRKVRWSQLQ